MSNARLMENVTVARPDRHAAARRAPFYLIMSVVLAAIAVFGFSHTVPRDFTTPGFPALLWVHGAVFTAWVLLFVAQPALVMNRSLRWHRRMGWVGVGLAAAMIGLAASAILLALWADTIPPFYPHGLFITRGVCVVALFAGLVFAGVAMRRHAAWHKRLMLCAAIVVVVPGLERAMPLFLFGRSWPFVVDAAVAAIALAGPVFDLATARRVHPAYLWGVGTILFGQAAVDVLAPSPVATMMLRAVGAH